LIVQAVTGSEDAVVELTRKYTSVSKDRAAELVEKAQKTTQRGLDEMNPG
jgi:hypothetical protein